MNMIDLEREVVVVKRQPVAIDMNVIIDPYKLLSVIKEIDHKYSEIFIPLPLSFIEIWNNQLRPFTFRLFEDKSIMETDLESFFGFTDGITTNNFIAGIKLLIMAYQKGMVRILDLKRSLYYEEIGKDILGIKGNFNNIERVKMKENSYLFINPDMPVSEMLFGMKTDNIEVIYGGSDFVKYWNDTKVEDIVDLMPTNFNVNIDKRLQTLLYDNKLDNLSDVFEYATTKNILRKYDIEFKNSIDDYSKKKDLAIITLEYLASTLIDEVSQVPIASTALFAYQFLRKIINREEK